MKLFSLTKQGIFEDWQYPHTNLWDDKFIKSAQFFAEWSKHDTKVGAVLINDNNHSLVCVGFNGCARGVKDTEERYQTNKKLLFHVHAEINLICNAGLNGIKTQGKTIYVNRHPCAQCAGAAVNAGIKRIVCPMIDDDAMNRRWLDQFDAAKEILLEGNVKVQYYKP